MTGPIPIGTVVGQRYEVVAELGSGGFATVYRARHVHMGRQLALKVLDTKLSGTQGEQVAERFVQEATLASQIDHPNVVTIHDFGFVEGTTQPFIVMQLFEGQNLRDELRSYGALEPGRALRLFCGCLDGLAEAHKKGVIHKDLKPSNLILASDGNTERLCIVDFGIATLLSSRQGRITSAGNILGTPRYLAPEYAADQIVTPALDVYQMGLILAEALGGQAAAEANTAMEYVLAHATGDLVVRRALLEPPLGPVLARALQKDHTLRFADAGHFRSALAAVDPGQVSAGVERPETQRIKEYEGSLAPRVVTEEIHVTRQLRGPSGVRELVFDDTTGAFAGSRGATTNTAELVVDVPSAAVPGFEPGEVGIPDPEQAPQPALLPSFEPAAVGVVDGPDLGKLARATRRARRGRGFGWMLALAVLALLALAGFALVSLVAPTALLLRPKPVPAETHALLTRELRWQPVVFDSADGQALVGYYGPAARGREFGSILYLHGLGDEVGARALAMDSYRDEGFDVLVFGHRGYGQSKGDPDMAAFGLDALEAYSYLVVKKRAKPSRLVVYGRGAGATAAAQVCADRAVGAVVTEGGFTTLSQALAENPLLLPASWVVSPDLDTATPLRQCTRPVLLLHGEADMIVPAAHSEALYQAGRGSRLLKVVPGAGHDDLDGKKHRLPSLLREFLEIQGFGGP